MLFCNAELATSACAMRSVSSFFSALMVLWPTEHDISLKNLTKAYGTIIESACSKICSELHHTATCIDFLRAHAPHDTIECFFGILCGTKQAPFQKCLACQSSVNRHQQLVDGWLRDFLLTAAGQRMRLFSPTVCAASIAACWCFWKFVLLTGLGRSIMALNLETRVSSANGPAAKTEHRLTSKILFLWTMKT